MTGIVHLPMIEDKGGKRCRQMLSPADCSHQSDDHSSGAQNVTLTVSLLHIRSRITEYKLKSTNTNAGVNLLLNLYIYLIKSKRMCMHVE